MATAPAPTPFTIDIPQAQLDDLTERLRRTRWATDYANDDWRYGTNGTWLRSMVDYWLDGYDWRVHEAAMNAFPHYRVELDGVPIHFIKVEGKGPSPAPLILTHGWPWTFWDFHAVIGPLSDPASYGGDPADAFDVIVPSLPGFGFSTPLTVPGVNVSTTADLWDRLMRDVLGYERYARPGRRLGIDRHRPPRTPLRRPPHRHPPQLPGPPRCGLPHGAARGLRARRGGVVRPHARADEVRRQPRRRAHLRPPDARLRPQRLPGRAGRLARSSGGATGATAAATPSGRSPATSC